MSQALAIGYTAPMHRRIHASAPDPLALLRQLSRCLMLAWLCALPAGTMAASTIDCLEIISRDDFSVDGNLPCIAGFAEQAASRGLVYAMQDYPQSYGHQGFGIGFADLNGNGLPDIIVLGAADGQVGLFENLGQGQFADRSAGSGIPLLPQGAGFAAADYDGDGLVDIYFTQVGLPDVLVRNQGSFQFSDVTQAAGLGDAGRGQGAAWADFTGNGWLDLYLVNNTYPSPPPGQPEGNNPSRLYLNNGDGTFTEVGAAQGVDDAGLGFQGLWVDFDRDGWPDLYLSNDRGHMSHFPPNRLWRNQEGQLVDVGQASGAGIGLDGMGIGVADVTGNGFPDLYITNTPGAGGYLNPLLVNAGDGTFSEASALWGVENPYASWGALLADLTNNGWPDLFVNNMHLPNTLFIHPGTPPMTEVAEAAGTQGGAGRRSFSAAVADVTGNGALDVLVNDLSGNIELFVNQEAPKRNFIRFRLVGQPPNHHAVGGSVEVLIDGRWRYQETYAGGHGYLGQNELVLHFGAGKADQADAIVARWPSQGPERELFNYPVNQTYDLYPPERLGDANGDGQRGYHDYRVLAACFNQPVQRGCEMMDFDGNGFIGLDDADAFFAGYSGVLSDCNDSGQPDLYEILLDPGLDSQGDFIIDACQQDFDPAITLVESAASLGLDVVHETSVGAYGIGPNFIQSGGGVTADFNNSGYPDLFVLGGNLSVDRLFINNGDGSFTEQAADWGIAVSHSGMGAAAGDFTGNGYLDLYLSSGGTGATPQPGQNRLYRNNGDGSFSEIAQTAGVATTGANHSMSHGIAWGDFDRDGKLDLYVTSWNGQPADNVLFHNLGDESFANVSAAAGVIPAGQFDGFQGRFTDMNGNGWPDLLVAGDFGTSRYFRNNGDGSFSDITEVSGTGLDTFGMGQAVGDLSGNGLLDWYVTSIYGDDSNATGNMLYLNQGEHVYIEGAGPAGLSDGGWGWGALMVDLNNNGLLDVVAVNGRPGGDWSNDRTRVFRNNGDGTFTDIAEELGFEPEEGRGLAFMDANRDGRLDLVVFNNNQPLAFYRNQSEGGHWLGLAFDTSHRPDLAPNGLGTRVEATTHGHSQVRYLDGSPSYLATSELIVHFGLGLAPGVDELKITWADGEVTVLDGVDANRYLTISAPP